MIENSKAIESWQEGSIIDKNGKYVKGIKFFLQEKFKQSNMSKLRISHILDLEEL